MIIGFTGNRTGLTTEQSARVYDLLADAFDQGWREFRHGDCVGSDAAAHGIALMLGYRVIIHPPTNPKQRAFCKGGVVMPEYPYLERNKHIVNASRALLATPKHPETARYSGTWFTVQYARERKLPTLIVPPDGIVVRALALRP